MERWFAPQSMNEPMRKMHNVIGGTEWVEAMGTAVLGTAKSRGS